MARLIKDYSAHQFLKDYNLLSPHLRILNAGSSSVRYGKNCFNIDIQNKKNVDCVCDMHKLPISLGEFDVIICNAALQYCESPKTVAKQFYLFLKPGGFLFIEAPWVQPFCLDTPDRFRFSKDCLKQIFSDFHIIKIGSSIRSGSAFAMLGICIAQNLTQNKYINYGLAKIASVLLYPFKWVLTADESKTAGGFYLICQRGT